MASIILTIKSPRADLSDRLSKSASLRNEFFAGLENYLHAVRGRYEAADVHFQLASADPVAATGTVTIDNSKIAADDVVTVAGQALTCKASGTAANTFVKGADATATAAALAAAVNASSALTGVVRASSALGVVTITCQVRGVIGNKITLAKTEATPNSITLSAAALANGTGAPGTEVSY
jgi:phage tail sheath gpL-like